ncbi:unnamed protein product [Ixodes persulcatus]
MSCKKRKKMLYVHDIKQKTLETKTFTNKSCLIKARSRSGSGSGTCTKNPQRSHRTTMQKTEKQASRLILQ